MVIHAFDLKKVQPYRLVLDFSRVFAHQTKKMKEHGFNPDDIVARNVDFEVNFDEYIEDLTGLDWLDLHFDTDEEEYEAVEKILARYEEFLNERFSNMEEWNFLRDTKITEGKKAVPENTTNKMTEISW